jgi:hypothetical protein
MKRKKLLCGEAEGFRSSGRRLYISRMRTPTFKRFEIRPGQANAPLILLPKSSGNRSFGSSNSDNNI